MGTLWVLYVYFMRHYASYSCMHSGHQKDYHGIEAFKDLRVNKRTFDDLSSSCGRSGGKARDNLNMGRIKQPHAFLYHQRSVQAARALPLNL